MSDVVTIAGLVKRYGERTVLGGIDLRVEPGSIVGLIGPNGAGKTTLLRCLLDLTRPDGGRIAIFGAPVTPATFERTAFVTDESIFFAQMVGSSTIDDLHRFQRQCYGARYDAGRAREVRGLLGISENRRVSHLSKGQRSAAWLSLAFAIRPALLVLDEPTSGLDPDRQRVLLDLLIDAAADGEASVIFSSHQITQVERAADRVAILRETKIVLDAPIEQLKSDERIVRAIFETAAPAPNGLAHDPRVRSIERSDRMIRLHVGGGGEADVVHALERLGARAIESTTPDLETIYLTTAPAGGERP